MDDKFIIIPGSPSEMLGRDFVLPIMVEDLCRIAAVPLDRLESFARALESEPGFASDRRLQSLVETHLGSGDLFEPVGRALGNLEPGKVGEVLARLADWREESRENGETLSEGALETLRAGLPILIRHYPAVVRQKKAIRLSGIAGRQAESLEIVCDLRPVFDDAREAVEGMIPVVTLKVGYSNASGEEASLEVLLSPETLEQLSRKAETAKKKMETLNKAIVRWIPNGLPELDRG